MATPSVRALRPVLILLAAVLLQAAAPRPVPDGYLSSAELPKIAEWIPPAPQVGSAADAADIAAYYATRRLLGSAEGAEAAADDVYVPERVAPRFADALGVKLDASAEPAFFAMMRRVHHDVDAMMAPVKKPVSDGGRLRPFVRFPGGPTCPITYAGIENTGSYPSGHATIGWTWALVLAEIAPDRADRVFARGVSFGQSRVICGFHWPSDINAGRLEAAALMARLSADPAFEHDFVAAKREVDAARGIKSAGPLPAVLSLFRRKAPARPGT